MSRLLHGAAEYPPRVYHGARADCAGAARQVNDLLHTATSQTTGHKNSLQGALRAQSFSYRVDSDPAALTVYRSFGRRTYFD